MGGNGAQAIKAGDNERYPRGKTKLFDMKAQERVERWMVQSFQIRHAPPLHKRKYPGSIGKYHMVFVVDKLWVIRAQNKCSAFYEVPLRNTSWNVSLSYPSRSTLKKACSRVGRTSMSLTLLF